ncbi:uncharacterized protein LOC108028221 [Drosophila biarmipes]|uniref:uncharacterized protein LOC108028221 n=1 Tax=Drosophila biarmipes TaxID=125945 RepID=UPI0007E846FE|nr:uncharacterized protein LOC108028221 [Drosophila biarmipes]
MSMELNEALEVLVENLSKSMKPEQQSYMQDAAEISQKINDELVNINSVFKGSVYKWDQTYVFNYKPYPKTSVPILWIDMPFAIEPQKVYVHDDPECRLFNLKTVVNHPVVENGYVSGDRLLGLFYLDLKRAVDRMHISICKSGKMYNICAYYLKSRASKFRIVVKEYGQNGLEEDPIISYEFWLDFNFSNDSVLYSYTNDFFHQVEKSKVEESGRKSIKLLTDAQKLLLQLQVADISLTVPAIKYLLDNCVDLRVASNTADVLLSAIAGFIPLSENSGSLLCVFGKLLQFKQSGSVQMSEIMALFGL